MQLALRESAGIGAQHPHRRQCIRHRLLRIDPFVAFLTRRLAVVFGGGRKYDSRIPMVIVFLIAYRAPRLAAGCK